MKEWVGAPAQFGIQSIVELDDEGRKSEIKPKSLLAELENILATVTSGTPRAAGARRDGVLAKLRRKIGARKQADTTRLIRTFEVSLLPRDPELFDLAVDDFAKKFGRHLTEPSLAVQRN